jgi:chorismate mutase
MTNNIENTTVNDSSEIQAARERINDLDKSIVDLLKKRFQASARIGQLKEESAMPVLDNSREKQVLEQVAKLDDDPDTQSYLQNIFQEILKNSRNYQHNLIEKEND